MRRVKSFTDLSYEVLKKVGKPMHYKEITEQVLKVKSVRGKTPEQTLRAAIAKDSRFKKVRLATYGLSDWSS